jgi:hypothetical protein
MGVKRLVAAVICATLLTVAHSGEALAAPAGELSRRTGAESHAFSAVLASVPVAPSGMRYQGPSWLAPTPFSSPTYDVAVTDDTTATGAWTGITRYDFRTTDAYPVAVATRYSRYLSAETLIQSNDPGIVSLAGSLVTGCVWESDAVERVMQWVRGNITYDNTPGIPLDAVSLLRNRRGNCAGFSRIAVALLRAARIPAEFQTGVIVAPPTGQHAWVSVLYPSAGWVWSEPQESVNCVVGGFRLYTADPPPAWYPLYGPGPLPVFPTAAVASSAYSVLASQEPTVDATQFDFNLAPGVALGADSNTWTVTDSTWFDTSIGSRRLIAATVSHQPPASEPAPVVRMRKWPSRALVFAPTLPDLTTRVPQIRVWTEGSRSVVWCTVTCDGNLIGSGPKFATYTGGMGVDAEGPHTLVCTAEDAAGRTASATATFTIDWQAPTTVIAGSSTYVAPATVRLDAHDVGTAVAHTYYRVDGGSQTEGTAIPLGVGSHTLEYWSEDLSGNVARHGSASVVVHAACTLSYFAPIHGSIVGSATQVIASGSSGTAVTAVPATGYHFVRWSDGGLMPSRTDADVARDLALTASFAINTYTLRYAAAENGTISGTADQVVEHGGSGASITAIPSFGYHFLMWSDGKTNPSRTDSNVTADKWLTAFFSVNACQLHYAAGTHGVISGAASQTVDFGRMGTEIAATPDFGYHFAEWSDGLITAARADVGASADRIITATFAINTYTLTPSSGGNGSVSPSTVCTVNYGDSKTFIMTASPGYHVADVLVDGESVGAVGSYPFTSVSGDHTISVRFDVNPVDTFALSYGAGAGGSIEGASAQLVASGANGTMVTAVPDANHHFVSWSDGVTAAARTDHNLATNKSVTANFAVDTHAITSSAGTGGSISPRGTSAVDYGADSATYTITPASGYVIGDVKVDGLSQGPVLSCRFSNVTAPHTISAAFKRKATLSITSDRTTSTGGHSIAFSGTLSPSVANGTHVTVWIRKSTTSTWTPLSTRNTFSSHHWSYSLSTKTRGHGTYYVQVRYAGSSTLAAATSSSRKIVIK